MSLSGNFADANRWQLWNANLWLERRDYTGCIGHYCAFLVVGETEPLTWHICAPYSIYVSDICSVNLETIMGFGKVAVAEIPQWTYEGKTPSVFTFFESVALAGLEGDAIRLSSGDQRRLLGHVVFGRRMIKVQRDGTIESTVSTSFGRDAETAKWSAWTLQIAAGAKKELHPSTIGHRYFDFLAHTPGF